MLDLETDMYQKIRSLLEGDDPWEAAFPEANRVWYDDEDRDPDETPQADGDYPRSYLTLKSGSTDLWDSDPTFGTHADDENASNQHWSETGVYVYELTTVSQLINIADSNKLGATSRKAIRKGGPRLGDLSYVRSIKLTWDVTPTAEADEVHEVRRFLTRTRIQVTIQYDGADTVED